MSGDYISFGIVPIMISTMVFAISVWIYLTADMIRSILSCPKLRDFGRLSKNDPDNRSRSKISVIIPARNEEKVLRKCLDSVFMQDYPNVEIILINDASSDRTEEIMNEYSSHVNSASKKNFDTSREIIVLSLKFLPAGWTGKNWACYQGYLRSTGDLFLFIDSDTVLLSPSCISVAASCLAAQDLDVLTLRPLLSCENVLSKITRATIWIFSHVKYSARQINSRQNKKNGFLFGCFYLARRKTYEAIGTHLGVKNEIIEDAVLGRKIKEHNFSLKLLGGENYIQSIFRWDWNNLKRIIFHFYKNKSTNEYLITIGIYFLLLNPFIILPLSIIIYLSESGTLLNQNLLVLNVIATGLIFLANAIQIKIGLSENPLYSLASPLASAIISFAFVSCLVDLKMNACTVEWRNRRYTYLS
ncbi:MAG TPA: glycosyltransferase [Nitrososphaeraceae archaeon]|jgi:glycosyltransferase involved in cell wall biosynthesis|nr:glycosyltransferase [Nitrososphaeraceae archaeon]